MRSLRMRDLLWLLGVGAAVSLIVLGAKFDEPVQTMMNAIMVCLACMGIG